MKELCKRKNINCEKTTNKASYTLYPLFRRNAVSNFLTIGIATSNDVSISFHVYVLGCTPLIIFDNSFFKILLLTRHYCCTNMSTGILPCRGYLQIVSETFEKLGKHQSNYQSWCIKRMENKNQGDNAFSFNSPINRSFSKVKKHNNNITILRVERQNRVPHKNVREKIESLIRGVRVMRRFRKIIILHIGTWTIIQVGDAPNFNPKP